MRAYNASPNPLQNPLTRRRGDTFVSNLKTGMQVTFDMDNRCANFGLSRRFLLTLDEGTEARDE